MKFSARCAALLLLLPLGGCFHKTQIAQNQPFAPPIEDTPPKPEPSPATLPPPEVTIPVQPPPPQITPPPEPVKKPARHKKPANTTQIASAGTPAVSAIGQLTTDPPDVRQQTDASIQSTEKALNAITRKLSDHEQETAATIKEYLKQARAQLTAGDLDGAHKLADKAKVLLDELHP